MLMLLRPRLDPIVPRRTFGTMIPPPSCTILVMRGARIPPKARRRCSPSLQLALIAALSDRTHVAFRVLRGGCIARRIARITDDIVAENIETLY